MNRLGVIAVLVIVTQQAAAQVELRWKWRKGEAFYVQTVTKVNQTLVIEDPRGDTVKASWSHRGATLIAVLGTGVSLNGTAILVPRRSERDREIEQKYEHTTWIRYSVEDRKDDGSAVLKLSVERDRGLVKGGEAEKPDTALDGATLTLHVDARGQVSKVEGADKLLDKLARDDTARRAALAEALSPEAIAASVSQSLGLLAGKAVKTGAEWETGGELKLGALGRLKLERKCKLESVENRGAKSLAKVSWTTKLLDYRPARSSGIAFQVVNGHLSDVSAVGSLEVDLDAGRPLSGKCEVKLAGYVTLLNTNVEYRARLAQEQVVTIKVEDRLPPKAEPMP